MKYHYGWYQCIGLEDDHTDVTWCEDIFGQPNQRVWFYEQASNKFYFKKQIHALWFELKFSENKRLTM